MNFHQGMVAVSSPINIINVHVINLLFQLAFLTILGKNFSLSNIWKFEEAHWLQCQSESGNLFYWSFQYKIFDWLILTSYIPVYMVFIMVILCIG